jgi:hypothetical protein
MYLRLIKTVLLLCCGRDNRILIPVDCESSPQESADYQPALPAHRIRYC